MKTKALLLPVLILALGLAACGGDDETTVTESEPAATAPNPADESSPAEEAGDEGAPAAGSPERSLKVEIVDFAYDPDPVQVETGGKVIWQNMDSAPHTATADDGSFDTGTLEEGKLKSESFKEPGTYTYFCEIHPTMHGTVEVVEKE
jgi:plastocyanin